MGLRKSHAGGTIIDQCVAVVLTIYPEGVGLTDDKPGIGFCCYCYRQVDTEVSV
jgi:hypothetical protein